MGNFISCRSAEPSGKLVLYDGSVQEFDRPIPAAELMLEHPQQVVVEFQSAVSRRRVTPLPADKMLDTKQTYLMLPIKPGKQPGLTSEETKRFLLTLNSVVRSRSPLSSPKFLYCFAGICAGTNVAAGVNRNVMNKENTRVYETNGQTHPLLEPPEGRPEYLYRQLSWHGWKPSLDPIEENQVKGKLSCWLSFQN